MHQKLDKVTLSIYQGIGGQIGQDLNHLHEINYGPSSLGKDPSLFTGEVTKEIDADWDDKSTFYITNDDPFPFTVRGIVFSLNANQD